MVNKSFIYALVVCILLSILLFCIQNNMLVSTQGSLNHWFAQNISIAISGSLYGLDEGLGYIYIRDALMQHGTIDDDIINIVSDLDIDRLISSGLHASGELDLGFAYFAKLAFYFFGYSVSSLFYFYFIIFIGSVILYLIEFKNRDEALVLIVLMLLAYYSTLLVLTNPSLNDGGGTIFTYRFITMLAIIPILHITLKSLTYYENIRNNIHFSNIALLLQSIIICSIYFIRATSSWIFILALFIFCLNIFFRKKDNKSSVFTANLSGIFKSLFFNKNTPLLILFTSLVLTSSLYKSSPSAEHEFRTEGRHVFWHPIFVGHAINPEIKKHYTGFDLDNQEIIIDLACSKDKLLMDKNISYIPVSREWLCERKEMLKYLLDIRYRYLSYNVDDQNGYGASFKYLSDNNQSVYEYFNFNPEDNINYEDQFKWFAKNHQMGPISPELTERSQVNFDWFKHFDWVEHDRIQKKVVLDAVMNYPVEMIINMAFFRPIQFLSFYLKNYFTSIGLLNLLFVFGVLLSLVLSVKSKCSDKLKKIKPLLATIFIFSMISPIVIYPGPHLIADQSVVLSTIIYLFLLASLVSIRDKIYKFKSK